jgi:hypothetical protein
VGRSSFHLGPLEPVERLQTQRVLRRGVGLLINRHMTVGGLAAEYGFTDLDCSQPDAWHYLVEAETDNSADVADQR